MQKATLLYRLLIVVAFALLAGCAAVSSHRDASVDTNANANANVSSAGAAQSREVTLLFTNDFESAFDPIPAYWNPDVEYLGGIAHIATLVDDLRQQEEIVFLFDGGLFV